MIVCHRNGNKTDKSGNVGNECGGMTGGKVGPMITARKNVDRTDDGTKAMVMVLLVVVVGVVLRKHKKSNKKMKSEEENQ